MNKSGHRREFPTGAIRHYLICAIWTNNNLPEMRDLPYEQENI